ncbi:MAG: anthranilate phosphoribosyltransferase, partial [Verrucomicrobiia bacterium]
IGEVSSCGPTLVAGNVEGFREYGQRAGDPGAGALEAVLIGSAEESAERIVRILEGRENGPGRDLVVENAAWALVVAGVVDGVEQGRERAGGVLEDGSARAVLEAARRG